MFQAGIRMHDLGQMPAAQLAQRLDGLGIHCGQLAVAKSIPGVGSYHDVNDTMLAEINAAFTAGSIAVSVLGCYIDPALANDDEREAQLLNFAEGIRCAAALHAGCIGTETTQFSGGENEWQAAFSRLCSSVDFMLEKAAPLGVTVAIEPVRNHTLRNAEATWQLLQRFKGAGLHIIFDPLNLLAPGQIGSQEALWRECMDAFGEKIVACHIKDANPQPTGNDSFYINEWYECELGKGIMRYEEVIKGLKARGRAVPLLREGFWVDSAEAELAYIQGLIEM